MKPTTFAVVTLLAVAGPVPSAQVTQRPSFRAGTELVTIDVSVRERAAPVAGLTASDFVLLDNGVRQHIDIEVADDVPVVVSTAFELSSISQLGPAAAFGSQLREIAGLLRHVDRLRVITFAHDVREIMPFQNPESWQKSGLPDLQQSHAALRIASSSGPSATARDFFYDPRTRFQTTALSEAFMFTIVRAPEPGRRHLAIIYATGVDGGTLDCKDLLTAIAARSDTLLQVGLWNPRRDWAEGAALAFNRLELTRAAEATGGEARNTRDIVKTFTSVLKDFRGRYLLRYTVTGVPRSGWHEVTVQIPAHPEYTIHHRRGYVGD
jgi:VWFA-related protein